MHSHEARTRTIALYESGLSARAIARWMREEHGIAISPQTISRWVREVGKSRRVGGGNYMMKITVLAERHFWSVLRHTYEDNAAEMKVKTAFDEMRRLGATHTRWGDLISSQFYSSAGVVSWPTVRFHMKYLSWAWSRGLDTVPVINYKADDLPYNWHWKMYAVDPQDLEGFMSAWRQQCQLVGSVFGRWIYYYQVSNEENYRDGTALPLPGVRQPDEPRLFGECFNGLLAGEKVYPSDAAHHKRYFRTVVNAFANVFYWDDRLQAWLSSSYGYAIDVPAIDHYPSTWTNEGGNPAGTDWAPLDSLIRDMNTYGKDGAIMETGFSTCNSASPYHDEPQQVQFVRTALPIIKTKVNSQNANNPTRKVLVSSWYELADADTSDRVWMCSPPFDPAIHAVENNFGILHTDLTRKLAWGDLQSQISSYGS